MSSTTVEGENPVRRKCIVLTLALGIKRKASEEVTTPDSKKLLKRARTVSLEREVKVGGTISEGALFRCS
jgi:hypothetical protein